MKQVLDLTDREILDFERPVIELLRTIEELRDASADGSMNSSTESLHKQVAKLQTEIFSNLTPHQKVQLSRHPLRPYSMDYISALFDEFEELRGDRSFADDPAIVGGMARFAGREVLVIGHQKGRNTKENVRRNFGMARPEGYRKATRLYRLASRFRRPIISLIDTPGAYPGIGAEERGQAEAIAKSLQVMFSVKTPIVSVIIGEGGSGGALALGVCDRLMMLEYATYSVISPEGCAAILWRDPAESPEAAKQLRISSEDVLKLGVCEEIIRESAGGAHRDPHTTARNLGIAIRDSLEELCELSEAELMAHRYDRHRKLGSYQE